MLAPLLLAIVVLLTRGFPDAKRSAERAASPPTVAAMDASASIAPATAAGDSGAPVPRYPRIGFRSPDRLAEHFRKHGREFHVKRAEDYLRLAQILRDRPRTEEVVSFVRNDAVTCKFDRASGAFVAYDSDGTLRTFFRPKDGEAYYERQKSRAHEVP